MTDDTATQDPAPTSTSTALVLTPPQPVTTVQPAQAADAVPIDPAAAAKIDATVDGFVNQIITLDVHDAAYAARIHDVDAMGRKEITASSEVSNRLLDRPVKAMGSGVFNDKAPVAKGLIDLRHTVEDLDPKKYDLSHAGARKLLGMIPFGDRIRNYFDKYKSAQSHINGIIGSLKDGQDELIQDNADIEQEKQNLWADMQSLRQYAYMADKLDAGLEGKITTLQTSDPEKAKSLSNDVLFSVRQKHEDLLTQLAVSEQGYLALNLIRQNNNELIKGVDRATTTTVAALRTAVIVAQALTNEKLVLDQITAVNAVTSNMIESTSEMLKEQTGKINEQAANSTIDITKLQTAFDNVFATLDAIDTFKSSALTSMKTTVSELQTQVNRAQSYVERAQSTPMPTTTPSKDGESSLDLPTNLPAASR